MVRQLDSVKVRDCRRSGGALRRLFLLLLVLFAAAGRLQALYSIIVSYHNDPPQPRTLNEAVNFVRMRSGGGELNDDYLLWCQDTGYTENVDASFLSSNGHYVSFIGGVDVSGHPYTRLNGSFTVRVVSGHCDNIGLTGMRVKGSVLIDTGCRGCWIRNCSLYSTAPLLTQRGARLHVDNCQITTSSGEAVWAEGTGMIMTGSRITSSTNALVGRGARGMRVQNCDISGGTWGAFLNYHPTTGQPCVDDSLVGNRITGGSISVLIQGYPPSIVCLRNVLIGNQILCPSGFGEALECDYHRRTTLLYNSLAGFTNTLFFDGYGDSLEMRNNVFYLGSDANAYVRAAGTGKFISENNCFWKTGSTSGNLFNDGGNLSWAQWQALGRDVSGRNRNPRYKSVVVPYDLHLQDTSVCIAHASPIAGVTSDIDGDARDPLTPDMGCDEIPGLPPDVGCSRIVDPTVPYNRNASLAPTCSLYNYGDAAVTHYRVRVKIGSFYNDTTHVPWHPAGTGILVGLPSVFLNDTGTFSVTCTTELAGDNNSNNRQIGSLRVLWHDVSATTILAPLLTADSGTAVTPACSVYNYGNATEDYRVRLKIGPGYNDTARVVGHVPYTKRYVTFPAWTPTARDNNAVKCSTELAGDRDHRNDTCEGSVFVRVYDVGATAILAPSGTIDSGVPIAPACSVDNFGNMPVSYYVKMRGGGYYMDSVQVTDHAPGTRFGVAFAPSGVWPRGSQTMSCSTMLANDLLRSDDRTTRLFDVRVTDAGLQRISRPNPAESPGLVPLEFVVRNYGTVSGGAVRTTGTVIDLDGSELHYDFRDYTMPAAGDSIPVVLVPWAAPRGQYRFKAKVILPGDHYPVNDSLLRTFTVGPTDVGVLRIVSPTGSHDSGEAIVPEVSVRNFGDFALDFQTFLTISNGSDVVVYSDSQHVNRLAAHDSTPVSFLPWPPPHAPGNYTVRCSVYVAGDAGPANDALGGSFVVQSSGPPSSGWNRMEDLPLGGKNKNVKDGGALSAGREPTDANDTTYVYAFKGNNRYEFYRYNTITNTWVARESIPAVNRLGKKKGVKKGSSLAYGTDGKVYATKGNNTLDWWQYDPATGAWVQKADVPTGAKNCKEGVGSAAVQEGADNYVYLLRGSGTFDFYRYNTATDVWDITLPTAPSGLKGKPYKNGSSITYDGNDTIYCLKGSYNEFAAYSISRKTWVTRDPLPLAAPPGTKKKKVKDGAGMAYYDKSVYALKGGNTNEFWMFNTSDQTWYVQTQLTTGSKRVKGGGALTYADVNKSLYAFRGNNTREYWMYGPLGADGLRLTANSQPKSIQSSSSLIAQRFSLSVTPNPITSHQSQAAIRYSLPRPGNISLKLYDISGKLVRTLASGYHAAGSYSYSLLTTHYSLASGIYLLKFESGGYRATEKVVIE